MRGNSHVRFLGGKAPERELTYPTNRLKRALVNTSTISSIPTYLTIAYNHLLNHPDGYKVKPKFYVINFDDPRRSHRCNPIHPDFMEDITDAYESRLHNNAQLEQDVGVTCKVT